MSIPSETLEAWTARLRHEAAGLDLSTPEGRVAFRRRVASATSTATCATIGRVAVALTNGGVLEITRTRASRALADAWIGL